MGKQRWPKSYTHFVYSRSAAHVHSGWEYASDAKDAARDLAGWGAPMPGVTDYRVMSRRTMEREGLL